MIKHRIWSRNKNMHLIWCSALQYLEQQIRSKINSFQNATFLISQPNPMMFHSLESSRKDDFNEGYIIGFAFEMRKLSWKQFCSLVLNCSPEYLVHAGSWKSDLGSTTEGEERTTDTKAERNQCQKTYGKGRNQLKYLKIYSI